MIFEALIYLKTNGKHCVLFVLKKSYAQFFVYFAV